jgi:hypothetical protein
MDGKIDFLKKTNPWGSEEEPAKPVNDPVLAAQQFMQFVERQKQSQNRKGKSRK